MTHYHALVAGYGVALAGWWLLSRRWSSLWPLPDLPVFAHPWREVGWTLLAAVATLGIGQLYVHGWRLPTAGPGGWLAESLKQIAIFSPFLLLLVLRKHALRTAWLPMERVGLRVLAGLGLALLAILALGLFAFGAYSIIESVYRRVDGPA